MKCLEFKFSPSSIFPICKEFKFGKKENVYLKKKNQYDIQLFYHTNVYFLHKTKKIEERAPKT